MLIVMQWQLHESRRVPTVTASFGFPGLRSEFCSPKGVSRLTQGIEIGWSGNPIHSNLGLTVAPHRVVEIPVRGLQQRDSCKRLPAIKLYAHLAPCC